MAFRSPRNRSVSLDKSVLLVDIRLDIKLHGFPHTSFFWQYWPHGGGWDVKLTFCSDSSDPELAVFSAPNLVVHKMHPRQSPLGTSKVLWMNHSGSPWESEQEQWSDHSGITCRTSNKLNQTGRDFASGITEECMIQHLVFVTVTPGVIFTILIRGNCPALQVVCSSSGVLLSIQRETWQLSKHIQTG